jgi:hypothetical protein
MYWDAKNIDYFLSPILLVHKVQVWVYEVCESETAGNRFGERRRGQDASTKGGEHGQYM